MSRAAEARAQIDRLTATQRKAREGRRDAHSSLMEAVGDSSAVPCIEDPEGGWTSDVPAEKDAAAQWCLACPVLAQCAAYVEAWPETGGVWAGQQMVLPHTKQAQKRPAPR